MRLALKEDLTLLARLLIKPFYWENAGLLFTVVFICFGLFPSASMMKEAHYAIMLGISTTPLFLLGSILLWSAYAYKCLAFVFRELRDPRNECLYVMGLGSLPKIARPFCMVQIVLLMPVLVYASLAVSVGFDAGFILLPTCIVCFLGLLLVGPALWYAHSVHKPYSRAQFPFSVPLFAFSIRAPFYLYFGKELLDSRKVMFLVAKGISLFLIWLAFYLIEAQELENRFVLLCFVGSCVAHVVILQKLRDFEDRSMQWMGNMPIAPTIRFMGYLRLFAVLLVPELLFLFRYVLLGAIAWHEVVFYVLFGVAALSYFHSILFKPGMNAEKYMNQAFLSWLLLTVCVQFRIPPYVLAAFLLIYSFGLYQHSYYTYEVLESESEE